MMARELLLNLIHHTLFFMLLVRSCGGCGDAVCDFLIPVLSARQFLFNFLCNSFFLSSPSFSIILRAAGARSAAGTPNLRFIIGSWLLMSYNSTSQALLDGSGSGSGSRGSSSMESRCRSRSRTHGNAAQIHWVSMLVRQTDRVSVLIR